MTELEAVPPDHAAASPTPSATPPPAPVTAGPAPSAPNRPSHARPSATGRERITALDGIRAVALLIIMGYHFGVGWLQGGFFSLDIFYVLSGYLITGLLLGEYRRRGRITLSAFWLRRARRLLPALLIVLVAVTLLVRFVEPAGLYPDFRMSALSALFYFSNWWQIAASGSYFVITGPVYPLTHTWSLAVEEQFYLVWPLVVLGVMTLARSFTRGIRVLLALSAAGAVASAVEMALLYHPGVNTTRLYFGTDTHAQSILVGGTLACVMTMVQMHRGLEGMAPRATGPRWRALLTVLGLAGLAGTFALTYFLEGTSDPGFVYRGGFFLSALSAAALIIGAVCVPAGPIANGLSLRPLVWLGTISYGAYLWHYPVFIVLDPARTGFSGLGLLAARFACTVALAAASYYLVERPVMEGTFWRSLKAVGPAAALMGATVAVIIVGTVVPATAAVNVTNTLTPAQRQALTAAGAFTHHPVKFMLVGDSMAETLAIGLEVKSVKRYGVTLINHETLGCDLDNLPAIIADHVDQPVSNCRYWRTLWAKDVAQSHPDVVGMLVGRWDISDHIDDGKIVYIGQPAWDEHLYDEINEAVSLFSARGAKVVLFTVPDIDAADEAPGSAAYVENNPVRVTEFNEIVASVAKHRAGVATLINLNKKLDPHGSFQLVVDGETVRWPDGVHISKTGGEWLQPFILPTVGELGLTARADELRK
jgi:peptidoglycan/LPS O-acetylase OafA/YrhL